MNSTECIRHSRHERISPEAAQIVPRLSYKRRPGRDRPEKQIDHNTIYNSLVFEGETEQLPPSMKMTPDELQLSLVDLPKMTAPFAYRATLEMIDGGVGKEQHFISGDFCAIAQIRFFRVHKV